MEPCCGRRFSHRSQPAHAGSPQGLDGEEDEWPQHRLVGDIHPSPVQSLKGSSTCHFSCLCWSQRRSAWLETAPWAAGEGWVWIGNLYMVRGPFFGEQPTATSRAASSHPSSWFCQFSFLSSYFLKLLWCKEDLKCRGQATCTWKNFVLQKNQAMAPSNCLCSHSGNVFHSSEASLLENWVWAKVLQVT